MNNKYLEYMMYESDNEPAGLPDGILFLDERNLKSMENYTEEITGIFKKEGYKKVIPPVFEYYETFEKGSGIDIARKSFSFKDKEGKLLSLRYDMTTPIARMVSMQYNQDSLPIKYYYQGDVFREQPLHKGRMRQIFQTGVECIGIDDAGSDAETIELMARSLEIFDKNYKIVVGDICIYKEILTKLELSPSRILAVHSAVNKKDTVSLRKIINNDESGKGNIEILYQLPSITGEFQKIKEKINNDAPGLSDYLNRLSEIMSIVPDEIKDHLIVDLGLIKDFSYYTSLTLEGYVGQAGYPIANGGRYDQLFQSFGRDYPAIGFALDMSFLL